MDSLKAQVLVEILKQGNGAASAVADLKTVKTQAAETGGSLDKLKEQATKAIAAIAATVAIKAAIEKYVEHEQIIAKLNGTLRASGQFSADYSNELQKLAKTLSGVTTFGSSAVVEVESLLLSFGIARTQVPKVTEAVLNLATLMGRDAPDAAIEFGKAMNGEFGALQRLGFQFDENASKTEKFNSLMEQVNSRSGGLARSQSDTLAGQMNQAEKALGGMQKAFGELALTAALPGLEISASMAKAGAEFLKQNELAKQYVVELLKIISTTAGIATATKGIGMVWSLMAGDAVKETGSLLEALNSIPRSIKIAIIGIATIEIGRAAYEAAKLVEALNNEQASAKPLGVTNAARRSAQESEISLREASGTLNRRDADNMRAELNFGFGKTIKQRQLATQREIGVGTTLNWTESQVPDVAAQFEALKGNDRILYPKTFPSGNTDAQAKQSADAKKSIEELAKLDQKAQEERLSGYEKEREAARNDFRDKANAIDALVRKGELGEDEKTQHIDLQREVLQNKLREITKKETEEDLKNSKEAEDLKSQLKIETFAAGLQKEREMEEARYQEQGAKIMALVGLTKTQRDELLQLNEAAHKQMADALDKVLPHEDIAEFEKQLAASSAKGSTDRLQVANAEYQARVAFYAKLLEEHKITENAMTQLTQEAGFKRTEVLAQEAAAGKLEVERLDAATKGKWAEQTVDITREFDKRRKEVIAYYDFEILKAGDDATETGRLETQKSAHIAQLRDQEKKATSQMYQDMKAIGDQAMSQFSSGLANALVNLGDASMSAGDRMRKFFSDLLKMIAQAILQMLILRALKSVFGDGGIVSSGGSDTVHTGDGLPTGDGQGLSMGGIVGANAMRFAASGLIAGTSDVSRATYFPKFNTIAGEAGRETLAVLAHPREYTEAGIRAIVGDVGPHKIAMMNASDLYALSRPVAMADGGMMGLPAMTWPSQSSRSSSSGGTGSAPGGRIALDVNLSPGLEARITENSVKAAEAKINQNLMRDTPTSQAVKRLTS